MNITKSRRIAAVAALSAAAWVGTTSAENMTASDRYLVDLALSGMPILLNHEQQVMTQVQPPTFEDFTPPGQVYLNTLASTGWEPKGGDANAAPIVDAFMTPEAGYLQALSSAGWEPPGAGTSIDMTTPGERYLRMLATAGWEPTGRQQQLPDMPLVALR